MCDGAGGRRRLREVAEAGQGGAALLSVQHMARTKTLIALKASLSQATADKGKQEAGR